MKLILLNKRPVKIRKKPQLSVMVDDADYEYLNQFSWHSFRCKTESTWYAVRNEKIIHETRRQRRIIMHREIMKAQKGQIVDHKDGNGLNNQRENLRFATSSQNNSNIRKRRVTTSKYLGVSWKSREQIWVAQVNLNKKKYYLGLFKSEEDAAKAYDRKALELHGEFANLNFK